LKAARVKHWSEYKRPVSAGPAPDLWDVVDEHGHILGPFTTKELAERHIDSKKHERKES
jgi:hypothetical protein